MPIADRNANAVEEIDSAYVSAPSASAERLLAADDALGGALGGEWAVSPVNASTFVPSQLMSRGGRRQR